MKIIYVANHDSGGNDDEGAILHALRALGHEVDPCRESNSRLVYRHKADLLLFHKWYDVDQIKYMSERMCVAFWYFDLVDFPDPMLISRCNNRIDWMEKIAPLVHVGFCTDGDWVADWNGHHGEEKLVWLTQGADERIVGWGSIAKSKYESTILFTGISRGGGNGREDFVRFMKKTYGSQFVHIEKGLYREELRDQIANSAIVVAPDSPVTDRYWSNRVYNAAGFAAFLIHPYCKGLVEQYGPISMAYYSNRDALRRVIEQALEDNETCHRFSKQALERTKKEHLYRHRCEKLIQIVKERCYGKPTATGTVEEKDGTDS